jgi:hypothetical protein
MSVPGITYLHVWHSEPGACEQCARLNGRVFADQDIFKDTLWDPIEGDIWDFNIDFSLTHGGSGSFCRCSLETRIIVDYDKLQEIKDTVEMTQLLAYDVEAATGISVEVPKQGQIEELNVGQIAELRTNIQQLKTEINGMSMSYHQLREVETLLNRTLSLIGEASGDKNVKKFTREIQEAITILRQLQMVYRLTQVASGPLGWALLGVTTIATIATAQTAASDIMRGTS